MSIETNFTAIPDYWMRRPKIPSPLKLMVGRLFTLSNIPGAQPEISASGLAEQTGFSWDSGDRVVKTLERIGVLNFKERRRIAGGYPFKVYSINRPKLLAFMESPASANGGRSSATGGCSHPLAADMASAKSGLKESGKEFTRKNLIKKGEPETLRGQLEAQDRSDATLAGSPVDKFDKFILPDKPLAVSGTPPEPLGQVSSTLSGSSGFSVTLAPETSASQTPPVCEPKEEPDSVGQTTATKSGDARNPAPEKKSADYWRLMAYEQHKNRKRCGSPFGRR